MACSWIIGAVVVMAASGCAGDGGGPDLETNGNLPGSMSDGSTTDEPVGTTTDEPFGSSTNAEEPTDSDGETEGSELPPDEELFACVAEEPCDPIVIQDICGIDGTCEGTPVWSEAQICRMALAMAASAGGISAELNRTEETGGAFLTDHVTNHYREDGTVLRQALIYDAKFETTVLGPVQQCSLQPPEYFQGCLDDPQWDCRYEEQWLTGCATLETFTCE